MFLLKACAQRTYGRGGASRRLGAAASLSVFEQALEECQHFSRQNRLKKHPDEGRYPNPVDPFWMRVAILIRLNLLHPLSVGKQGRQPQTAGPWKTSDMQPEAGQRQPETEPKQHCARHFTFYDVLGELVGRSEDVLGCWMARNYILG